MSRKIVFDFYNVLYDRESRSISEEVLNIVKDLKDMGEDLYLFTNSGKWFLEEKDRETPFLKYFTNVIACENDCKKPSEEAFEKLLEIVGGKYEDILLIDDSEFNIEEAKKLGIMGERFVNADSLRKVFGV
jgi:HAD superfamily hydrolase (TIGR01509 family)